MTGQTSCFLCPQGTYNNITGQSACVECNKGYSTDLPGQISINDCTLCPAGEYSLNDKCTQCPGGTYGPFDNVCQVCSSGTWSGRGFPQCVLCSPGYYNPYSGSVSSSSCLTCDPGTYSHAGQSYCSNCTAGTFSLPGSSSCMQCPAGTYGPIDNICQLCNSGTYSGAGQSYCTACSPGTYNPQNGSATCIPCGAGSYNPSIGQTLCVSCGPCTYSSGTGITASECFQCVAGKFYPGNGSTTSFACAPCGAGTFSPYPGATSVSSCISCEANTYSTFGQSTCTACPSSLPISPPGSSICFASYCKIPGEGNIGAIPLLLMIPFAFIGSLVYYARSKTSSVEDLSFVSVSLGFAITGLDLTSDVVFVIFLLSGSFVTVTAGVRFAGALFIIIRFLHPLTFLLTIGSLFGMYFTYLFSDVMIIY